MRRTRIMLLCLVAAFAVGALEATSSTAFTREAPEVGRCLAHKGGKWKEAGCKTAAKTTSEEKFEWYPAFGAAENGETKLAEKLKFTSVAKADTTIELETTDAEGIICHNQTANGEVTGPKTLRAYNVAFTGCEALSLRCKSTNPAASTEGEVKVKELGGTLGVEKFGATSATNKIANLFVPMEGEIFTEFECGGVPVTVRHEVMNPVTADKMILSGTVKFTATKGKQKPEKFATDPTGTKRVLESSKLNGGGFVQAGQSLTTIQTNEEKLEINTVI